MKVLFYTLGCKVNQYETQAMRGLMENEGWETRDYSTDTDFPDDGLVIVINSCTVTGESDRKLRQLLRRMRRGASQSHTGADRMYAAGVSRIADRFTEADIVLGSVAQSNRQPDIPFSDPGPAYCRDNPARRKL